ncbi:E3 ubiquitin-protein ligase BRE1-like 1 [Tasmannia lanceolata]|uniref:E3 ubiquitin-protein ligase BRE1-like 1 n=1 Tax=Tasmannia lanceolata TaxID=3420 RepID=UPI004064C506
MWSEQVGKLTDDGRQSSVALESTRSRLLDVQKVSQELRQSLDVSQSKVQRSRLNVAELQIELEKERFEKKRIEEQLEVARRKAACLTAHTEGSSVLEKHQQELREYNEILGDGKLLHWIIFTIKVILQSFTVI